ncbi:dermonecrotic toxin domain-containing protein [Pseudomonas sp. NPDC089395]|uniref:dermonecrotic toxin domain-containing protein n=1 Tax=Pseudomonas sp. NPDC089395 TaxID=3364460 RepID=UPI003803FDF3
MTMEQDNGIAYALIAGKTPDWMKNAPPSTHASMNRVMNVRAAELQQACQAQPAIARALATEHARLQAAMAQVRALYQQLPDLQSFAKQQLGAAIKATFGLEVDVNGTYLLDVRPLDQQPGQDLPAYKLATRSLLESALRNFDASAAQPGGMDNANALLQKSVILDHRGFMGTVPIPNTLDIAPERFAEMCRKLDIGGQYQARLQAIHYSDIQTATSNQTTYAHIAELERCTFMQSLHLARLQHDISQRLYEAAIALPLDVPAQSPTLTFSVISLWDVQLTRIRLFDYSPRDGKPSVALYLPGDAETPLREFESQSACEQWIRDRLLGDIGYLDHCMKERDKAHLQAKLLDRLTPLTLTVKGTHERRADPHAKVHLQARQLSGSLLQGLVTENVFRHEEDAAFHAIPTTLIDTITAVRYREHLLQKALTTLNIAGFFIPAVGEVMLGVCALQLAYEVYEGIESWAHDDQQLAYQYVLDVVQNMAEMAAFTVAMKAFEGGLGAAVGGSSDQTPPSRPMPVETPSFIEELDEVELAQGQTRLWQADLRPYAQVIDIPDTLAPDNRGLLHHQGRTWLELDGQRYSVGRSGQGEGYHIEHPTRANAYQPPLRHNGADIWLHPLDRPELWPQSQLLRRSGNRQARFDENTARRILRVSNIDEDVLRKVLCDNQRLPGQLDDTFARFELYQRLAQSTAQLGPEQLQRDFQHHYQRLPTSQAAGAQTLRQRYPQLPSPVIDELLDNSVASELAELGDGKVPRRLADEVRLLQQQVRLNRAYEGLYLDQLRNWDTDQLILHTLGQLPGWPADISITLEQRGYSPNQNTRIGPGDAGQSTLIVSARAGYVLMHSETADAPLVAHPSLHGALFEALSEAQRAALGVDDALALKTQVQQAPWLPRPVLRQLLGMQPVLPGYRSPMRLADGRIGYPLGGTRPRVTSISRQTLLARIRQVGLHAPQPRPAEQTLSALENRNLDRDAINDLLGNLLEQRNQLQTSLGNWRQMAALLPNQAAYDFEQLAYTVSQYWYDRAFAAPGDLTLPLRLERLSLLDFPLELPSFFTAGITDLQLFETQPEAFEGVRQHAPRLNSMLRQFTQLRTLEITRTYRPDAPPSPFQFSLPLIAEHLPALQSLSLTHQNLVISTADIDSLASLAHLRRLDLSGNRFSDDYPPDFGGLSLDYLGLDNMQLEHWPDGLGQDVAAQMQQICLRGNAIRLLPDFLAEARISITQHPQLSLQGNAINDDQMLRVLLNQDGRGSRFEMDQPAAFRERLNQELALRRQLDDLLDNYVNASSSTAMPSPPVLAGRSRISTALRQFWQNQEIGLTAAPLRFDNIALELFPTRLPAFLTERVHHLRLEQVSGSTVQLQNLFSRFPRMTQLTLDIYVRAQQDLPTALQQCPGLRNLTLRNIGLEVDQHFIDALGVLPNLDTLDLSNNRAGAIDHAPPSLQSLRRLDLNGMDLDRWPDWVDSLRRLQALELGNNHLTELPAHLRGGVDINDLNIRIGVEGNPLSAETTYRARAVSESQSSFTFRFDAPDEWDEDILNEYLDDPEYLVIDDTPRLTDWLLASEVENQALHDAWQQLQDSGQAQDLLALVGRLKNTASYRHSDTRLAFCQRVRKVLVRALVDADDLALFNIQAREALTQSDGHQTCQDGALLTFKSIELYIASEHVQFDGADSEANLYREMRRLYRLHAVDEIANREANGRDEAEVRLTYLRELNAPLQLGQPVDSLRYPINPTVEELIDAQLQVQRGELGEAFLRFAASNELWVRHLRQAYAQRFAQIERTYQAQVIELQERYPDRPLDTLTAEFNALARRRQVRESHLIRELTAFADPDRRPRSASE